MLAAISLYLPYLLPLLYLVINEVIAHNPNIQSNSLLGLAVNVIVNALKAAIGANPPKPLP